MGFWLATYCTSWEPVGSAKVHLDTCSVCLFARLHICEGGVCLLLRLTHRWHWWRPQDYIHPWRWGVHYTSQKFWLKTTLQRKTPTWIFMTQNASLYCMVLQAFRTWIPREFSKLSVNLPKRKLELVACILSPLWNIVSCIVSPLWNINLVEKHWSQSAPATCFQLQTRWEEYN